MAEANLKGADLKGASYDIMTMWPYGFDPVAAGAVYHESLKDNE
jgi:hypothetical protein